MPYITNENKPQDSPTGNCRFIGKCQECNKSITEAHTYLECDVCKLVFHPRCKGVIGQHIQKVAAQRSWYCNEKCRVTVPEKSPFREEFQPSAITIFEPSNSSSDLVSNNNAVIMAKLNEHGKEFGVIKALMEEIKTSQVFVSAEFEKMKLEYQKVVADNKELLELLRQSSKKNKQQQERIDKLEASVDEMHQTRIENNLVIAGIPNEDIQPREVLKKIFQVLACEESINDVAKVEYMKQRTHHNTPVNKFDKKLLVTFITNEGKLKVQEKKKRQLVHVSQVGYENTIERQVFFRDHLTLFRLKLYNAARQLNKLINYKYLWINRSVIYFRKEERAPVIRISSQNDIDKLLSANNIDPTLLN